MTTSHPSAFRTRTVASFTSRPLRWFSLLSLPLLFIGTFAIGYSFYCALHDGGAIPMPIAGSGVIFFGAALIMMANGALGEFVYHLGDMRESEFSRLTQRVIKSSVAGE